MDLESPKVEDQAPQRHEAILSVVTLAAEKFLRESTLDNNKINNILARLGESAEVSRVYIFENHIGTDGALLTSQRYEWAADGIMLQGDNPDLQNFPWRSGGMERWEEALNNGKIILGNVRDFPLSEQEILSPQGIQSIVAVPIFVADKWWGFIGFDECKNERQWSESEIDALKTTGAMLGAIIGRKQIEDALHESEKRYTLATTAGLVGVWDWNLETNEIYIDPKLKALIGYADHEIRNHLDDWGNMVHPDDRDQVMAEAEKHLKGLTPQYEVAHRMLHKDGTIRWFLARGTAIRDKNGMPIRMIGTDTDITERRRTTQALKKAHDGLEHRVKIRTAELRKANEELKTKTTNLEEANIALKILLKKRDEDKVEIEEKVLVNVKELIDPFMDKLKKARLNEKQKAYVDIIESNLKDITSTFAHNLSSRYLNFTPAEIQVAKLVREGKTTKEIAELLNLSYRTISFYRENIRKKLDIKNKKANLRSHLLTLL